MRRFGGDLHVLCAGMTARTLTGGVTYGRALLTNRSERIRGTCHRQSGITPVTMIKRLSLLTVVQATMNCAVAAVGLLITLLLAPISLLLEPKSKER